MTECSNSMPMISRQSVDTDDYCERNVLPAMQIKCFPARRQPPQQVKCRRGGGGWMDAY